MPMKKIMKGVERFLFGVICLLWGVFSLGILNPGAGDCHCCDFSKDECLWEMSAYGLTAAWLVAGGIVGRGVLGRWGKWTCAVFWGIAALAHWVCSRQIGWPEYWQISTFLATCALSLAFLVSFSYCLVCMVALKDWRGWLCRVLTVGWLWLGVTMIYENGKYIFALNADLARANTFGCCCYLALVAVFCYGVIRCVIRCLACLRRRVKKARREDIVRESRSQSSACD